MSLVFNTKTYPADGFGVNVISYAGPARTVSLKDDLSMKRVLPKPTATFSGVGRTAAKLTRTMTLAGALTPTWDGIIEINVTLPVGTPDASADALVADAAALLATSSFLEMVKKQKISF